MKTSGVIVLAICCAQGCSSVRLDAVRFDTSLGGLHSNGSDAFKVGPVFDFRAPALGIGNGTHPNEGPQPPHLQHGSVDADASAAAVGSTCTFDDNFRFEVVTTGLGYGDLMSRFSDYVIPVVERNLGHDSFHVTHFDENFDATRMEEQICVKKSNFRDEDLTELVTRQSYVLFDLANLFLYKRGGLKVGQYGDFENKRFRANDPFHVNALYIGYLPGWDGALLRGFSDSSFVLFRLGGDPPQVETYVDRILGMDWSSFPVTSTSPSTSRSSCKCTNMQEKKLPSTCWQAMADFCFYTFHEDYGRIALDELVKSYACANDIDIDSEATTAFNQVSEWLWR